jgi:uncharacterized protein (TIGR02099 family)
MMRLQKLFRRARTLLWTAFSILVILAAVLVGLGELLMPYSERYQPRLEAWLSAEIGQPVAIESFEGEWAAFGPRISLRGMKLLPPGARADGESGPGKAEVVIESAALDIKPLNLLVPGLPLYRFRVIGADFELLRTKDGQFRLSGFGVSGRETGGEGSALRDLARVGGLVLENSRLDYLDERLGISLSFAEINGRLELEGEYLATEVTARLLDKRAELVYGEIEATLLLTLGEDQKMRTAAWQATCRELMLAAFQGRLPPNPFLPLTGWLNAELWGEWSPEQGFSLRGVTDLKDAWLVNDYQDLTVDHFNTRFRWEYGGRGHWQLHLAGVQFDDGAEEWTAPRISMARDVEHDLGLWISADELPLGVPMSLARDVMSIYGTAWPKFLPGRARGRVEGLELGLDSSWRLKFARGRAVQASVSEWDRWPDLAGLNATVALRAGAGRIRLDGRNVRMDWPRMFREPLVLDLPGCSVDLRWGNGWQAGIQRCAVENEDLAAHGNVIISGNQGRPGVDVNVVVERGNIGRLDPYWPEAVMSENIKDWLRGGLLAGDILSGRLQIHGDLDDWPFRAGEGRFEAQAEVGNAAIDYRDGWPRAEAVDASLRFVGPGMEIEGRVGKLGSAAAQTARASISDLKSPLLRIEYRARDELADLLGFIRQTPLYDEVRFDLNRFTFAGQAETRGSIRIPLGSRGGNIDVSGELALREGLFSDPSSGVTLSAIDGALEYTDQGFSGSELTADFRGYPARLDLQANFAQAEKFRAQLSGVFGARDIIPEFLRDGYLALKQIDGDCRWDVVLSVRSTEPDGPATTELEIRSDLTGLALNLPAPLDKPVLESWPFVLRLPLTGGRRTLDVLFEDRAALRFVLGAPDEAPRSVVIGLGPGLPDLPPDGRARLEGQTDFIDLDDWVDLIIDEFMQGAGMADLSFEGGRLAAGRIRFLDRHFDDVQLSLEADAAEIRAEFESRDIDGELRFTVSESGANSLSAEFERLVLGEPLSAGMEMDSDPSTLPALHLYVGSFSYSGVELGETRIEAFPTAGGFHFEKIDAASDRLSVQARGDWVLDEQGHRSDFYIHMASESLGDFLQSMDISSSVQGGQTLVDFTAWWPGSPAAFALSRLNGEIEFSVVDGNITGASAGTGRLLGLLSVQALPKRLALDFRDVFDAGFSFDEATGTFRMENGMATTDDVLLTSTSAKIMISGQTDLVRQRYDQLLTIRPGVGNTLPIIGALAAGPGGAAAGLALQGLLQDELAEATQVRYSITGDWDDPQFEAVEIERVDG